MELVRELVQQAAVSALLEKEVRRMEGQRAEKEDELKRLTAALERERRPERPSCER